MIHIHSNERCFELHTDSTCYALPVDENQRLGFRAWAALPSGHAGPNPSRFNFKK